MANQSSRREADDLHQSASDDMQSVETAARELTTQIEKQFVVSAQVTAIDLNTMGEMNNSATTFYAGMNERISHLVSAADRVQARADDAKRFSKDIELIFQKARRLEALVDRLDEYTSRQEAALSHNRR